MKTKILISAANGVVMTTLIKRLRKKFYVVGIDAEINGNANESCDEFYHAPKGNTKKFIPFIKRISKKVDYIFFFADEEILNINRNKHLLKRLDKKIILSEKKTINICLNKKIFYHFCKINGISIPTESYSKEMIAKPIYGRGSKNIFKIKNKNDYLFLKKKGDFIVQKFIQGTEFTVDCLFDEKNDLVFSLPRIRIVHNGVSIIGKIVKNNKINKFIKNLSNKLKFTGPINIQLIKDKKNKLWIIEVNPRLSGSIEFSIKAGFNPILYYQKNKKKMFIIKLNIIKFIKDFFRLNNENKIF